MIVSDVFHRVLSRSNVIILISDLLDVDCAVLEGIIGED